MWQLDPWSPEYRLVEQAFSDRQVQPSSARLDLEGVWSARRSVPVEPAHWPPLFFVDGRQRIEARLGTANGESGLLATIAVGALLRDQNGLRLWRPPIVRRVFLHTGHSQPNLGDFTSVALPELSEDQLPMAVTQLMRKHEAALIAELPPGLVIADGPLMQPARPGALGYTKTQAASYLPPAATALLTTLNPGERTPIFDIDSSSSGRSMNLYSWYVRLPLAGPYTDSAALTRVETLNTGSLPTDLADFSVSVLCATASSPGRDPRAPQNLLPIAGLEQVLGRYLGNSSLIRRQIMGWLVQP